MSKNRAKKEANLELWRGNRGIRREALSICAVDIVHLMMPCSVATGVLFVAGFLRSNATVTNTECDGDLADVTEEKKCRQRSPPPRVRQ